MRRRAFFVMALAGLALGPGGAWVRAEVKGKVVPFVTTPEAVVDDMLRLAEVKPDDVVYDLGSGDGRIVIEAARRGARGVGVDVDPARIRESRQNAEREGVSHRARFVRRDLFKLDLRRATAVTIPRAASRTGDPVSAAEPCRGRSRRVTDHATRTTAIPG